MCFEILGFDVLIDTNMKPWVLEINISPSFSIDTPLDFRIKKEVIEEITTENLDLEGKKRKNDKNRVLIKCPERKTLEEKNKIKQTFSFKRNTKESEMINNYRLIYPNSKVMEYENYIRTAKLVWEEFTGNIKAELKNSDKKDQSTTIVVPPIRSLNEFVEKRDTKETLSARRNRPVSAAPINPRIRITKTVQSSQSISRCYDDSIVIK